MKFLYKNRKTLRKKVLNQTHRFTRKHFFSKKESNKEIIRKCLEMYVRWEKETLLVIIYLSSR